jgi:hypothetical protein
MDPENKMKKLNTSNNNTNNKIVYMPIEQFKNVKGVKGVEGIKLNSQPGERFLALVGYDYQYMDSSVKDIAEKAEQVILDLEKLIARLMLPTRNVQSILPILTNVDNNSNSL